MNWLEDIVDKCLEDMSNEKFLMMTCGKIPGEMLDTSIEPSDDWRGWKPIASIITDEDINLLEKKIKYALPLSYRHFLKYKHFIHLRIPDIEVNLPNHLPDKNLTEILELVFNCNVPELVIGKGFIYFADFSDYGLLCFDANETRENNEYPVVYIDHELGDVHLYANNFRDLLEADDEKGNRFIEKLNEYYRENDDSGGSG